MIHGAYGNPDENWFPWLKKELESRGHKLFIPRFPTPEGQDLKNWLKTFKEYEKYIKKDTIMIGHSVGAAFILDYLEISNKSIRSAFLVSGFTSLLGNPKFDNINKTFVDKGFDWKKIKGNCVSFHLFHSDNDPYVPLGLAEDLARNLRVPLMTVKGAGHFNAKSGYIKFDQLLKKIIIEISK